jgi:SAM-dependent methyltransferase
MPYEPREFWEARAKRQGPTYVGHLGKPDATRDYFNRYRPVVEEMLPERCGIALDFGCGSGRWTKLLAGRSEQYVGVDLSKTGLSYAVAVPDNARLVHLAEDRLPFRSDYFDTAIALWVLQHVPNDELETWAAELRRTVKTGGIFVVIDNYSGTAEHMFPRNEEAIAEALSCQIEDVLVRQNPQGGSHWCARMRRV